MVFWEGSGRAGWHREKLETPHGFLGKFLLRRWTHQKKMKCQYGCWEGSRYQGQRTKKNLKRHMVFWQGSGCRNATWSSGKVFAAKVDAPIKLETPHRFLERFLLGRSTYKKKSETPHGFLGRLEVRRSMHKKKLETPHGFLGRFWVQKRHMVFWEGSWGKGRRTKKTWNATRLSGKVLFGKVGLQKDPWNATWRFIQKKLETPRGFLVRFWCEGWLPQKNWNTNVVSGKVLGAETPHGFPCFLGGSVGKVDAQTWFYFF